MQGIRIFTVITILCITALLVIGCSGKGTQNLTGPGNTPPGNDKLSLESEGYSGYGSLGAFEVILDLNTMTGDISPLERSAGAIGDNYQIDATKFFIDEPCNNCFRMDGFGINSDGNIVVDFSIQHPFQDTSKRLDLDAFDVKLILISDGSPEFGYMEFPLSGMADTNGDGELEIISGNTEFVLNADGYTTHLNMVAELVDKYPPDGLGFEGNLNPFKFFFTEDDPDPLVDGFRIQNHRMQQGASWDTKRFEIKFPSSGGFIRFITAIEVAYGQSAVRFTRMFPVYYLPQFNQKEAFSIVVEDSTNSLNTAYDSSTVLDIRIADWQNYYLVDLNYPDSDNTIGLEYNSDIYRVMIEIPQITPSAVIQHAPGLGGTGRLSDPMRFEIEIFNQSSPPVSDGVYKGLVTVEDMAHPKTISIENDPYYPEYISDIRAYKVFDITVNPNTNFDVILTQNGLDTGLTVATSPPCAPDWEGQSDLAVFNNGITSGVYMANEDNDIVKFNIDYSNAPWDGTIFAEGSRVVDSYGTHPCNTGGPLPNQPVYRIDAAPSGAFIITNMDDSFTIDPGSIQGLETYTWDLPNSALVRPYDSNGVKSFYFLGKACGSSPGPSLGERVWAVFDDSNDLGSVNGIGYITAGPLTEGCGSSIDVTCIKEPYAAGSRYRSRNFNYLLADPVWDWDFLKDIAASLGTAKGTSTKILWMLWPDPANPGVRGINIMDNPVTSTYASFLTNNTLTAVDLELLKFDPSNPRSLNGIGQTSDWIVVLYREGVIDIYAEDGMLMDTIDGRLGSGTEDDGTLFWGEPMHIDTDNYEYRIHVTFDSNGSNNPGGNIYVSVFSL